jgi:hypothetical protein
MFDPSQAEGGTWYRGTAHKKGDGVSRCGTLVGDLNNPLGSQRTRRERQSAPPPSHSRFGNKTKSAAKVHIYVVRHSADSMRLFVPQ